MKTKEKYDQPSKEGIVDHRLIGVRYPLLRCKPRAIEMMRRSVSLFNVLPIIQRQDTIIFGAYKMSQ